MPGQGTTAKAAAERPSEFEVKAAYLYNFGKFVRWPEKNSAGANTEFTICVLGRDPFDGALEAVVSGQTIGGRPIALRKVVDATGVPGCRVLYVPAEETRRFRPLLDAVRKSPILTVSDAPDFLERGGIIQFVLVSERVRFAVSMDAAQEAGLQLSAELLKVATRVVGPRMGGER